MMGLCYNIDLKVHVVVNLTVDDNFLTVLKKYDDKLLQKILKNI